jgi:hypothetical protein
MEQIKKLTDKQLRDLLNECDLLSNSIKPALEPMSRKMKSLFKEFNYMKFWFTKFNNVKILLTYEAKNRFVKNEK